MRKSIVSISSNKVLNNILYTIVSEKYVLIPLTDVFLALHELRKKETIQLVLIDIDDQNTSSLGFVRHLTSSWLYQRPVIALASNITETTKDQLLAAGVNVLIKKPFDPLDLVNKIDELITCVV
jgi:DNA-binding response OmpR family regulator